MDEPFTFNNPGYWLNPRHWPTMSNDDQEHWSLREDWKPRHEFLLRAVHLIGAKAWGNRWRTPPFRLDRPDDVAALDRFRRTIVRVRALCAGEALSASYEELRSDGPDGRYDEGMGDSLIGTWHSLPYGDWFAPGWEQYFLTGRVGWSWIYVWRDYLEKYLANLQPQQDEPAPPAEPVRCVAGPLPQPSGKRGPRTGKTEEVVAKMQAAIDAGGMTREELAAMKEEVMAVEYDVSRDTARTARKRVLGISTK
jgi:hypothetical protein